MGLIVRNLYCKPPSFLNSINGGWSRGVLQRYAAKNAAFGDLSRTFPCFGGACAILRWFV